jgi:hypothetical protein
MRKFMRSSVVVDVRGTEGLELANAFSTVASTLAARSADFSITSARSASGVGDPSWASVASNGSSSSARLRNPGPLTMSLDTLF